MTATAVPMPLPQDRVRAKELESVIRAGLCSMKYDTQASARRENTRLAGVRAGSVDVVAYCGDGVQIGRRSPQHIRNDWADHFILCMPQSARFEISQGGVDSEVKPGSFVLLRTTRPFDASVRALAQDGQFASLHVRLPGPSLRLRVPHVDDLCNRLFSTGPGAGHVLRTLLETSLDDVPHLTQEQAGCFGGALLDIVSSVVLDGREAEQMDRIHDRSSWRQSVIETAKAFIESHLSNPDLDTAMVARHCRMSIRYLHAAFAASDLSIASYIRETRLLRCREALRDPRLRNRSLMELAARWGFSDQSHFSRCYRSRFGIAPRDDRQIS